MMIRRMTAGFLVLALALLALAAAENNVELLPATPPMPRPVPEANPYAADDLSAYYDASAREYQLPALTASEQERLPGIQQRWEAGERPKNSVLNLTENVQLSVMQLPLEQYEGEPCFLILPNRELTDEELLQVVDAYGQLGLTLDPGKVNWHNCMRGGGVEVGLRILRDDERERYSAIGGLYIRSGLRPEKPYTSLVADDGLGRVSLDEEAHNGLDEYRFYPARRLTDEELLQLYALHYGELAASPDEMAAYESQLREELHLLLGMPLSARRSDYEYVRSAGEGNLYGDDRTGYTTVFTEAGGTGRTWSGMIDITSGRLIEGSVTLDDRYYADGQLYSDIRMNPWDEAWTKIALQTVAALRGFEESGITEAWCQGETTLNDLHGTEVRVRTADGGVYRAEIAFVLEKVMTLRYNDAVSMACEDDYYIHQLTIEEVPVNE